jgi:NAD(P)-dependent dehydrogenase (short-subunit alcohol dehydrogenase family)
VVLACRNQDKAEAAAESIRSESGNPRVSTHVLDLGDLEAVRDSAQRYLDSQRPLHVLVNNAGLAGHQGLTRDGFEVAFGTNHLGHFLWTLLLLDRMRVSTPARIVMVASRNHSKVSGIDYGAVARPTQTTTGLREYGVSKLANVLFASELARRLAGEDINTYSLNPGRVASDIWKRVPWPLRELFKKTMLTNEEGAKTSVMCACDEALADHSGRYYDQCREVPASDNARSEGRALELWERSCEMVGLEDPLPR